MRATDPQVGTVANLTNAANAIIVYVLIHTLPTLSLNVQHCSPPITGYPKFRKPIVTLDDGPRDLETASHHEDALDRHVEDVMRRRARFKRIMKGVWSFLKTRELAHSPLPWQVAHQSRSYRCSYTMVEAPRSLAHRILSGPYGDLRLLGRILGRRYRAVPCQDHQFTQQ